MNSHQLRFVIIAALTLALFILMAVAPLNADVSAAFRGALTILVPALFDAGMVEQRRRDPAAQAIEDDVKPKG